MRSIMLLRDDEVECLADTTTFSSHPMEKSERQLLQPSVVPIQRPKTDRRFRWLRQDPNQNSWFCVRTTAGASLRCAVARLLTLAQMKVGASTVSMLYL